MTHEEHLIENAIFDMQAGKSYEEFAESKHNKAMSELSGVRLESVWMMAQHVVYTLKPGWVSDKEREMEDKYGYRLDQRDFLY